MKTFEVTNEQMAKVEKWQKQHNCSLTPCARAVVTASSISFTFRETSLIREVEARCDCGAILDLTEYENG